MIRMLAVMSEPKFHLASGVACLLPPQVNAATSRAENLKEFGNHFGGHPKPADRTFTGGPDFFLKKVSGQKKPAHSTAITL
jgi:hypothetical protein